MKKSFTLGLALAATLVGSLATSGAAMAVVPVPFTTVASGSDCHNYYAGEDIYFDHYENIYNNTGSSHWVSCPLVVHHTTGVLKGTVKVRFDGSAPFQTCTLYGIRADGSWLTSKTVTGINQLITFNNVPVGPLASYVVDCNLQAGGSIFTLEATF